MLSPPSGNNNSYNSATWERTLRMNSSSGGLVVPPPLGSAPPPSTAMSPRHKPVRTSLSGSQSNSGIPEIPAPPAGPAAEDWSTYRSNKISTAKTLQLHRQLSAGSGTFHSNPGKYRTNLHSCFQRPPPRCVTT